MSEKQQKMPYEPEWYERALCEHDPDDPGEGSGVLLWPLAVLIVTVAAVIVVSL